MRVQRQIETRKMHYIYRHRLIYDTAYVITTGLSDFSYTASIYFVSFYFKVLLNFAPPRPSPSSLLLSSTKAGEVLGLTGAIVPPKFHLRILLHARPSFRQLPCGSRSGVGTIVQRNEDFVDYTAGTSLSGRRLLLAFAFTRLNFDKD